MPLGMERYVYQPLIRVERAEYLERMFGGVIFQRQLCLSRKFLDGNPLFLEALSNLLLSQSAGRNNRLRSLGLAETRGHYLFDEFSLTLGLLFPIGIDFRTHGLLYIGKEQCLSQHDVFRSLAYRPAVGRGLPLPLLNTK